MANTITIKTLEDTDYTAIIHIFLQGEVGGSDETNTTLINTSSLSNSDNGVIIEKLDYALVDFSAIVRYDINANLPRYVMPANVAHTINLEKLGHSTTPSSGQTDNIKLATKGLTSFNSYGHIRFWLKKVGS